MDIATSLKTTFSVENWTNILTVSIRNLNGNVNVTKVWIDAAMELMSQSPAGQVFGWRASAGCGPIILLALVLLQSPANGKTGIRGRRFMLKEICMNFRGLWEGRWHMISYQYLSPTCFTKVTQRSKTLLFISLRWKWMLTRIILLSESAVTRLQKCNHLSPKRCLPRTDQSKAQI